MLQQEKIINGNIKKQNGGKTKYVNNGKEKYLTTRKNLELQKL